MAQAREKGGRVVFIGNIPYGVSEEQICDIFGRIGSVLNFRLVYDKETGKPKGFGFLEYPDVDQAAAAVRNLNGFEIMGRQLKVDYSNDNSGGKQQPNQQNAEGSNRAPPPAHFDVNVNTSLPQQHMGVGMGMPNGAPANDIPPLPQGVDVPPGLNAPEAISKTLQAIPPAQLLDILSQMKTLAATEPAKATAILQQAPQLSYAIFQALILLGLVDTSVVTQLIQQTPQQQPPPLPQQTQPPPQAMPYQQPQAPPAYHQQQQPYGQPPQAPPPNPYAQFQQQHAAYNPTPPTQHAAYQPPPQAPPSQQPVYQQQPPPPQQQAAPDQQQQHQQLIQQVLAMTRDQIFSLPETSRNQLIQLRAQLGHPVS